MEHDEIIHDEGAGLDATDLNAAALSAWDESGKTDPPAEAPPEKVTPPATEEGKTPAGEQAKPPQEKQPEAAADAEDISKAAFFNEPKFQEYYKQAEDYREQNAALHKVFDECRYKFADTATLKAVLEDAFTLYDISNGKTKIDKLFDLFEESWDPGVFKDVVGQMAAYAAKKGAAGAAPAAEGEDNPLAATVRQLSERIEKYERSATEKQQREEQERTVRDRLENEVAPLQKKIVELCKTKGLTEQADIDDYAVRVADMIGQLDEKQKSAVLAQVRGGKWGEVERLFAQYHNVVLDRAKRHADAVAAREKENANAIPRVPAGGSAPTKRPAKHDLATADGVAAAALEHWNQEAQN